MRGGRRTIRPVAVVWVSRRFMTSFFLTHGDHEDRPAVPGLRTHRLFIRREQPVRVQLTTPRLLTAAQVPRIGFLVLEGCCQTGCRQGGVGRVLSDPPQQLGQGPGGLRTAAAGLASCGPRPRGSGRPWPARGVPGRGTPPASRRAAPAARASRGGRGSGRRADPGLGPGWGRLARGRAPRGPSPSFRRVGDSGCGGATTGAGAATDSSGPGRAGTGRSGGARGIGRARLGRTGGSVGPDCRAGNRAQAGGASEWGRGRRSTRGRDQGSGGVSRS